MLSYGMRKRPDLSLRNQTHGLSKVRTKEYRSWKDMRARCLNEKNKEYHNYGGRGIVICDRWSDFALFYEDMGNRPSSTHTLDRIDVNGNYEPLNCRWADRETQANNKRCTPQIEYAGKSQTISQWCREYGIDRTRVEYRLKQGMNLEDALKKIDLRKERPTRELA